MFFDAILREPFKNVFGPKTPILALFDPFLRKIFGDFLLMGGVYPPTSLRKKSAKNGYFWPKNADFSPF